MRPIHYLPLGLLALSLAAHADVYKWKDAAGHVHYSDQAPDSNAALMRNPVLPAGQADAAVRDLADQELAFKKRQEDAAKAKEKANKEAEIARIKEQNCENAHRNLDAINQNSRIYRTDANGQRNYLSEQEIADSRAKAEKVISDSCQ